MILQELADDPFHQVCELGCGSGPNLLLIKKTWPQVQVGGVDINADAIKMAKTVFPKGVFDVRPADDLFFATGCVDVALTDMCLIYYGKDKIRKVIKELKRIARRKVILVEFHSKNPLKRLMLKIFAGYNSYNYKKILEEEGFYEVKLRKIPLSKWPGGEPQKTFGYIITATP